MSSSFDILGLGCVAVDDLLFVSAYPRPDTKLQVRRRERQCGGLTGTALVAAARLGAKCAFGGVLGDDPLSAFVLDNFVKEGVDVSQRVRRADARPIHSTIIVDESSQTRTILFDLDGAAGADCNLPSAEIIAATPVLYVDHYGIEGMTRAARIAREAGNAVVADFENGSWPGFDGLLELVDHVIVSREFAAKLTGKATPAAAAQALSSPQRKAAIVTCGAEGCWYVEGDADAQHQPALRVQTLDTTGCGDVFHGAYAAALVHGLDMPRRVRFASAAAALKATRAGGQAGIPTRAQVESFLKEQRLRD